VDPRHFFRAGEVMPRANIEAPLSALDRLLGRRPRIDVHTVWKLVAYATDSELRQKPIRPADPV